MEPQPTVIWDIDGDGDNEVVCVLYCSESEGGDNRYYVAVLNSVTGAIEQKTLFADGNRIAESLHPANLLRPFGRRQEIVVRTGGQEQLLPKAYAYDRNLDLLWEYYYSAQTAGPQCHRIKVWDIDYDGYDEVLLDEVCLQSDGDRQARVKCHGQAAGTQVYEDGKVTVRLEPERVHTIEVRANR